MLMQDISDAFLNDVLLPQVFITDYMSSLSPMAIKVYLLALLYKDAHNKVDTEVCRRVLGISTEDMKATLLELHNRGVIKASPDLKDFTLIDLKRKALRESYRPVTNKSMSESVKSNEKSKDRQALIRSINNTYFQGMMGPSWYQAIDNWFDSYDFDPAVVYQMFSDAAERNVLNGPNYLNTVAESYAKNGVKTFKDLSQYKDKYKKVKRVSQKVGKALNKKMTKYDERIVEKWVLEYGYDFPFIEIALRAAVRLSEPNLNYFDKILSNWHEAGIKTEQEAENVLRNNQQNNKRTKRQGSKPKQNPRISEREYDEDFLSQFYIIDDSDDEENEDE